MGKLKFGCWSTAILFADEMNWHDIKNKPIEVRKALATAYGLEEWYGAMLEGLEAGQSPEKI